MPFTHCNFDKNFVGNYDNSASTFRYTPKWSCGTQPYFGNTFFLPNYFWMPYSGLNSIMQVFIHQLLQ